MEENQSFFTTLAMYGYAVTISFSVFAPIERIKIILQTHRLSQVSKADVLKRPLDAFRHVRKNQGFLSFWNGNGTYIVKEVLDIGIRYSIARGMMKLLDNGSAMEENNFSIVFKKYTILFISSFFSLSMTYPLEVVRIRLMKEMTNKQEKKVFKGFGECLKTITFKEGLKSLFKGYFFSSMVLMPYLSLSFGIYEYFKISNIFNTDLENLVFSVLTSQLLLYPFDTVRKRLQTNGGIDHLKIYLGARDCLTTMWKTEGMKGYYAGFLMNAIRVMPQTAFQLMMFNQAFQFFEDIKDENARMMA